MPSKSFCAANARIVSTCSLRVTGLARIAAIEFAGVPSMIDAVSATGVPAVAARYDPIASAARPAYGATTSAACASNANSDRSLNTSAFAENDESAGPVCQYGAHALTVTGGPVRCQSRGRVSVYEIRAARI